VCTPGDALRTFVLSNLKALVLGNLVVEQKDLRDDARSNEAHDGARQCRAM
jgi:hypothetical protein